MEDFEELDHNLDFVGFYKITFRDQGIPRNYQLAYAVRDPFGRVIYLVTHDGEYINHDNILKFKKVEHH
jgi:hypothetical protein